MLCKNSKKNEGERGREGERKREFYIKWEMEIIQYEYSVQNRKQEDWI